MVLEPVTCRYCSSIEVVRYGTQSGASRFKCKGCQRIFKPAYRYNACAPDVPEHIVNMAMNGSGTRDTARVLNIGRDTVTAHLKKASASVVAIIAV
jgi:transposase